LRCSVLTKEQERKEGSAEKVEGREDGRAERNETNDEQFLQKFLSSNRGGVEIDQRVVAKNDQRGGGGVGVDVHEEGREGREGMLSSS